jgi:cysteine desulfurase/selenocysteine lyase
MIYLNNAATSFPKPACVGEAIAEVLHTGGMTPSRSSQAGTDSAARVIYEARGALARLLGVADPAHLVFTLNATDALNLALRGLLRGGGHVVTTSMEHNSVARPLRALEADGIKLSRVRCDSAGVLTRCAATPGWW